MSDILLPSQSDFTGKMDLLIGAIQNQYVVDTTAVASGTLTMSNNTCYRIGTMSGNLQLDLNDTDKVKLNFETEVVFTYSSGTLSYADGNPSFTGTDCSDGVFTPVANKTYDILIYNISTTSTPNLQAIVRGI